MPILILYATTEGQTRKIVRRAAQHLAQRGITSEVLPVTEAADTDLGSCDAVLLAASVHAGRYQPAFVAWVTANHAALAARRTAFLSVSLSAASSDPEDRVAIEDVVRRFIGETGWTPGHVEHVAGAFRFTQYDFLKAWAMRWMASRRDPDADRKGEPEYTDWQALFDFLDRWAAPPA